MFWPYLRKATAPIQESAPSPHSSTRLVNLRHACLHSEHLPIKREHYSIRRLLGRVVLSDDRCARFKQEWTPPP
jgi:hypothetical protein